MEDSGQINGTVEMVVDSVTITSEGMADTIYSRTITDNATGKVVLRDAVRETAPIEEVFGGVVKTVEMFLLKGTKADISANVTSKMFKTIAPPEIKW